ncbi:Smr/MutS family protein, partial [Macromonas nakdongensis]|uniref:Smr/MutS family protein n=1 Tax=Macromonas nakdongensis TaxID=1843082 RepID=UPI000C33A416
RQAAHERAHRDRLLFERAVGAVQHLPHHGRHLPRPDPLRPLPQQRQRDEQAVMQEALSDEFDAETLLHTDEHLSFRRPGVGPEVVRKLRQGDWSLQAQVDLHGLRTDEARSTLAHFIREAHKHGLRCVRVVHGKGLGSPGKTPVLKGKVHSWLVQKNEVMAFVQARPAEGGAGALVVLLRPSPRA